MHDYYKNKDSKESYFKDNWCKSCIDKYVQDVTTLKEYCYYNNRVFSPILLAEAEQKIDERLSTDEKYLIMADIDTKIKYRFRDIKHYYFSRMNLGQHYIYQNSIPDEEIGLKTIEQKLFEEKICDMMPEIEDKVNKKIDKEVLFHSDLWYGEYSQEDLRFLDDYYNKLASQFDISDIHMEDNCREVAKIVLERNKAYADYLKGVNGAYSRYKQACEMYIKLSDQSKLSASKRTSNDKVGFSDLGSLIKRIENSGALMRKVKFDKDDVDTVLEDFAWILRSFEGESFEGNNNG